MRNHNSFPFRNRNGTVFRISITGSEYVAYIGNRYITSAATETDIKEMLEEYQA